MTKLKIFIIAQIVLGNLIGLFAVLFFLNSPFAQSFIFLYFGLVASHVSLLGFWAGMGLSAWWKRLLGLFAGIACLWIVGIKMMGTGIIFMVFSSSVIAGVVVILSLLIRTFGVQLQRIPEKEHLGPSPKMQFTIRGLFMVTFCAALLLSVARVIHDERFRFRYEFLLQLEFSLVIIFATLLCMWAALSLASPYLPTVITIVVVLLMSLVVIWSIGSVIELAGLIVFDIFIFLLSHFGWTLANLLVLRSCGYRITAR